jgi:hypothetical protein
LIAVDSSAWIDHFRNKPTDAVRKLRYLFGREPLVVGDLVLAEVLQGARDETHAGRLEGFLREFEIVSMVDDAIAVRAARHFRDLRARGITPRKTTDVLIGTWCIVHGHALLHDDRDFAPMREHLGLQVV